MSAPDVVPPTPSDGPPAAGRAGLSGGTIATGGGVAGLVVFMAQNRDDATLTFLLWSFTWPLWLLVLVSAVLGSLVWIGLGVLRRHRRRVARRAARRGS
ncbi:LapA family protein [Aquipuribacter sp. SD81]|uniref:LapA family protein n=1 Tax=Aquipuribacter sp. SD81 TaxID=3127703 RepID=UPI0030172A7D